MTDPPDSAALRVGGDPETLSGPFIFTCEHASPAVPGRVLTPSDREILNSHWGWDIGAADVVRALCRDTDSTGVLSQYSRLLVDVNRRPDSDTLIVAAPGGTPVSFNRDISPDEYAWRMGIHRDYHETVDALAEACLAHRPVHLVSVHSFTPVWDGKPRTMEVGILFDIHESYAQQVATRLKNQGVVVALNEPYSGLAGELMFGASRNGQRHNIPYLEFELRQDLISTPKDAEAMAKILAESLKAFYPKV